MFSGCHGAARGLNSQFSTPKILLPLLLGGCAATSGVQREDVAPADASSVTDVPCTGCTYDHGGIIRGDPSQRRLALIFTGGEYGEGSEHILDVLRQRSVKASFFVTGDYIRIPEHQQWLRRMVAEGHYLGPHSDAHPLYCSWEDRQQNLVTREFFEQDLRKNIEDLRAFGAFADPGPIWFIPPYEWYNQEHVDWSRDMGLVLFNFTPRIGSHRDWMPESDPRFNSSRSIYDNILQFEKTDPDGLNGALMLLHLGADRKDKMFLLLDPLIEELESRGYRFARVDELLGA
jgi:peptidoglycan/xylan/chitin deacetylase (PgdA/CDA1 family)